MSMISPEIQDLLKEIRSKRDYFAEDTDEQLIYKILTEWLHYENEEHLNDWLRSFFWHPLGSSLKNYTDLSTNETTITNQIGIHWTRAIAEESATW